MESFHPTGWAQAGMRGPISGPVTLDLHRDLKGLLDNRPAAGGVDTEISFQFYRMF